jgi:hypothetical protein
MTPASFEIRLDGQLDERWGEWFEGFSLTNEDDGTTTLTGQVVDQAALHGLLRRVGDLGVTLISFNPTSTIPTVPPDERSTPR